MSLEMLAQKFAENLLKLISPQETPSPEAIRQAKVVAHRGFYPGYKENTLESFIACKEAGVWGIEFDIRWTKDLTPIVLHDDSTARTHGTQNLISNTLFKELKRQHPDIPSLNEVIQSVTPQCHLMIELKEPLDKRKNTILKELLADLEPIKNFHLMSLNVGILNSVTHFPKKSLLSIAMFNERSTLRKTVESDIGGMTGSYILLTNSYKHQLHQHDMLMGTGYIDSKFSLYKELNRGMEYLFTNNAKQIMQILHNSLDS